MGDLQMDAMFLQSVRGGHMCVFGAADSSLLCDSARSSQIIFQRSSSGYSTNPPVHALTREGGNRLQRSPSAPWRERSPSRTAS